MSLLKRGKVWWSYFYIDGKRHQSSTGTGNKRQAESIEQKLKEEINARRFGPLASAAGYVAQVIGRRICPADLHPQNLTVAAAKHSKKSNALSCSQVIDITFGLAPDRRWECDDRL